MVAFSHTRLAPTPSGFLHLGNLFSFALTASLAKRAGAGILLRIDDLDAARAQRKYIEDIFDTLYFCDIPWQRGPRNASDFEANFSQSLRLAEYHALLARLRAGDALFACDCSRSAWRHHEGEGYPGTCLRKNIPLDTPGCAWRLKAAAGESVGMRDRDGLSQAAMLPPELAYFIVRKKDGLPAYQLASLADDTAFGIDFIVRGEDLRASTVAQLCLASRLGMTAFGETKFFFHGLLGDAQGQKLSKSADASPLRAWREEGISREDMFRRLGLRIGLREPLLSWEPLAERMENERPALPELKNE